MDVARILLSHGVETDVLNVEDQSPLHLACKAANREMISLLLEEGASTLTVDTTGKTPIDLLPLDSEDIKEILENPPTPTMKLRELYLQLQQENMLKIQSTSVSVLNHDGIVVDENGQSNHNYDNNTLNVTQGVDTDTLTAENHHGDLFNNVTMEDDGTYFEPVEDNIKDPVLVIWPPAQRQVRCGLEHFKLINAENLVIGVSSDDSDVFALLNWSGLIETLEHFGIVSIIRKIEPLYFYEAKMRFAVDINACGGRHRYELTVTTELVQLVASDNTGFLYGLYALIQLLQLHSDVKLFQDGYSLVEIPPVAISDWPDTPNRGILWSYQSQCRLGLTYLQDNIQLFSKLRLNQLYLVIDVANTRKNHEDNENQSDFDSQEKSKELSLRIQKNRNRKLMSRKNAVVTSDKQTMKDGMNVKHELSQGDHISITDDTYENEAVTGTEAVDGGRGEGEITSLWSVLGDVCDKYCVELIPTVVISNVYDRYADTDTYRLSSHLKYC